MGTTALTRYESVQTYLSSGRIYRALAEVMPRAIKPERVVRVLLGACQRNPELLECTPFSLAHSMLEGASLGFTPGDVLGYAYMVPYKNHKAGTKEATLIVGYKGLIQLAYQSPQVVAINGGVVCEGDEFEYELGARPTVKHRKGPEHLPSETNVTAAYAIIHLTGASWPIVEVLVRTEIDARRKRSRARTGPWFTDFGPMCQKTALRALLILAPKTTETEAAMARESAAEAGAGLEVTQDILPLEVSVPTEDEVAADPQPAEPDNSDIRDDEVPGQGGA